MNKIQYFNMFGILVVNLFYIVQILEVFIIFLKKIDLKYLISYLKNPFICIKVKKEFEIFD